MYAGPLTRAHTGSIDLAGSRPHTDRLHHQTTSNKGDTTNVAVKIRLKRMGKIRTPFYRIVVADSRSKRDGRVIEEVGTYNPKADPSVITVVSDRAQFWLGVGAQPTEAVVALLKLTGDWETFSGEKQERKLEFAAPKPDKAEIFNEALKAFHAEPKAEAVTKKKAAKKVAEPKVEDAEAVTKKKAAKAPAKEAKVEEPKADKAPAKAAEPKADKAPAKAAPAKEAKVEEPKADKAPAEEAKKA